MISWPAACGIRWVKPSTASVSPSRTVAAMASARDEIRAIQEFPVFGPVFTAAHKQGQMGILQCRRGDLRGGRDARDDMPSPTSISEPAAVPLRAVRLGAADAVVDRRADGTIHIRTARPLGAYHGKLSEALERWAREAPGRLFLSQRDAVDQWRELTYAEVLDSVKRIGAALLRRGLSAERPVVILSGNDIEHALLALAAMYVGIPYAPVSPAYSLMSGDFGKLRMIMDLLTPGLVFASDGMAFGRALYAAVPDAIELVVGRNPLGDRKTGLFADLLAGEDPAGVAAAHTAVTPDTIAKFLFTSGSTTRRKPSSTPSACCAPIRPCSPRALPFSPMSRRWWWTGCPGATPSAATTTSTWCWSTAARSTSTTAIRRRPARRRRRGTCAPSPPPSISTCRRATRRWCRICAPTKRCAAISFRG